MILKALALRVVRALAAFCGRVSRAVGKIEVPFHFSLFVLLLGLALVPLTNWKAKRDRDTWWVKEIAAKSGRVTAVVREGNIALSTEDAKALKEVDDARSKALDELSRLKIQRSKAGPLSPDCMRCSIPLDHLRLRQ